MEIQIIIDFAGPLYTRTLWSGRGSHTELYSVKELEPQARKCDLLLPLRELENTNHSQYLVIIPFIHMYILNVTREINVEWWR